MTVKIIYNEDGSIEGCEQIVNKKGDKPYLYEGLVSISNPEPASWVEFQPETQSEDKPTPKTDEKPVTEPGTESESEKTKSDIQPVQKPAPQPETQPETPKPKDKENLERIDEQIQKDIAEDIGSEEVKVTQTPSDEVKKQPVTTQTSAEVYGSTGAITTENQKSTESTPVQSQVELPENNYVEDLGGANAKEYSPVPEAPVNQADADAGERTPNDTLHAEDAGSFSVDGLLAQP